MVRTYGSETSSGGDSFGARQYDGYGDARDHHHRGQPHHADHGGHQGGYDDETHPRYPPQSYGYGHHPAQPGRRERVDADGGITGVCLGGYGGGTTLSPAPAKSFGVHRMRKNEVTGKVGGSFGDVAAMQRVMGHDAHHPNAMPPPRRFNDRAIDAHASSSVYVPGGGFGDGDDRWGDGVTGKVGSGVAMNQRNRVQPPRGFNDRAINAHASSSVYVPGGGFGGQGDEPEHPTRRRQQHQIDEVNEVNERRQQQQQPRYYEEEEEETPAFFPCDEFMGPRPGWCFKVDRYGLGYYRDPCATQLAPERDDVGFHGYGSRDERSDHPRTQPGRSATHHSGSGDQNRGNSIGTRPTVRQSKLFRRHESGNAMKDILGSGETTRWDENKMQGGYSGATYDHEAHNDALLAQHERASVLREVLSEVRGGMRR